VREEGDAAAVDAGTEELEHGGEHGDRAGDGAGDDGDRPAGDPVEDRGPDDVLPCHRDRDGRARDDDGAAGGAGGAFERVVGGEASPAFLA
jgi:hypothetical protein